MFKPAGFRTTPQSPANNVTSIRKPRQARASGTPATKDAPSTDLLFATAMLADADLAIGGLNRDGSVDETIYRWTADADGQRWQTQSHKMLRAGAQGWLRANLPGQVKGRGVDSCLAALSDLMLLDRKFFSRAPEETNIIPLRNAYLLIESDGTITAHMPDRGFGVDYVVAADLDWSKVDPATGVYMPTVADPTSLWGRYLASTFNDQGTRDLAQEAFSTILLSRCYEKMILMYGEGKNGKSVMQHILKSIIPKHAAVRVNRLSKNEFGLTQLNGARLALIGEMPKRMDEDTQMVLKGLISRDPTPFERKGKDEFTFTPRAVWVGATNHHIAVSDHEHGFHRKILTIPFTNRVATDSEIYELHKVIVGSSSELTQVIDWLLIGAVRLIKRGRFMSNDEMPVAVQELAKVQRCRTDTVAAWLEDAGVVVDESVHTEKQQIYNAYVDFTIAEGKKPVAAEVFWSRIAERFRDDDLNVQGVQRPSKADKKRRVRHVHLRVDAIEASYFIVNPTPDALMPVALSTDAALDALFPFEQQRIGAIT